MVMVFVTETVKATVLETVFEVCPMKIIPENIRKCMAPQLRKELNCPTNEESKKKIEAQLEKQVHRDFQNWCNRTNVKTRHQRMDKRTSEAKGWPDFQCMANGRICFVEFKVGGNKLTPEQDEICNWLSFNKFNVLITDSYSEAAEWVSEHLDLDV